MSARLYQRILLTGGGGFVGATMAPALASTYPHADRLMLRFPGKQSARAGWQVADVSVDDRESIEAVVADFQPDLILHLAAQSSIDDSAKAGDETWRVNFNGSLNLGGAMARHGSVDGTFLYVSSSEVYGRSFVGGMVSEDSTLQPMNIYARTKAATEAMLPDVLRPTQRLIVARPFNHTGAGQDRRFALPSFAAQIAEIESGSRTASIDVGNLDSCRDFLNVADVCDAYIALLQADLSARTTFNIASGRAWRIGDLLERLKSLSSLQFDIVRDPARARASEIPSAIGDARKLSDLAGWMPKISMDETLVELISYWRARIAAR